MSHNPAVRRPAPIVLLRRPHVHAPRAEHSALSAWRDGRIGALDQLGQYESDRRSRGVQPNWNVRPLRSYCHISAPCRPSALQTDRNPPKSASLQFLATSCAPRHARGRARCRAAFATCQRGGWSPRIGLTHHVRWSRRRQARASVVLRGRATNMPFTAVMTGPERTTGDNPEAASTCAVSCLRR
jgi:hypothetical protein